MHMIDIFDSIDMQTAYVLGDIIVDRMQKGFNGTQSVSDLDKSGGVAVVTPSAEEWQRR